MKVADFLLQVPDNIWYLIIKMFIFFQIMFDSYMAHLYTCILRFLLFNISKLSKTTCFWIL